MNIPKTDFPRVVVIGGGFAGIAFIEKLKREKVQIVLFDRHNYHTFQPLLYQVSTASLEPDSIAYPLRKVFRKHKNFHFRLAEANRVDPHKNKVYASRSSLHYDYLVISTGTRTNFFGNDSIAENSLPMKTVPQALNIRSLMLQNIEVADRTTDERKRKHLLNFVMVGGGPTGVELAGALAEFRKGILENDYPELNEDDMQVHLIEGQDRLLPPMSEQASKKAEKFLLKINVILHLDTFISDYDGKVVSTNDGKTLEAATFIWAAGVTGAPIEGIPAASLIEKTNRYKVDAFNKIIGSENIYALGDVALMETETYPDGHPQVAQPAIQQGKNLGVNFRRMLHGKKMKPFKYTDKGTMRSEERRVGKECR